MSQCLVFGRQERVLNGDILFVAGKRRFCASINRVLTRRAEILLGGLSGLRDSDRFAVVSDVRPVA